MVQELEVQIESVKFFVNGEEVIHHFSKPADREVFELTVREILNFAGFTPEENYELKRDSDGHTYTSVDDEVSVENGDRFTAVYKGVTPAS